MEKDDNLNRLDALKRRRDVLASLAARRRLNILSSSTPKQHEEGNTSITTNANSQQRSSLNSNSSDVIEDSDIEINYHENSKRARVVNSSGNSNDSFNTSTFCLPMAHAFFGSPCKQNESDSLQTNKSEPKIRILSEIIIPPPIITAPSSVLPVRYNDIPQDTSVNRSTPISFDLIAKPEIEMLSDTQILQHESPPTACDKICFKNSHETVPKINVPETSQDCIPALAFARNIETYLSLENKQDAEPKNIPTMEKNTSVNVDLSPNTPISTMDKPESSTANIVPVTNTLPDDVQNIPTDPPTDIDDQGNSPSIMHDMNIPNDIQHPGSFSSNTSDHIVVYEPVPGPSSENRIRETPKGRKRYLRPVINKAHIDYLSDEEQKDFSAESSDLWSNAETDTSSDSTNKKKRKKKKKKKMKSNDVTVTKDKEAATLVKKKEKRCNVNRLRKTNKAEGKAYETRTGIAVEEKKMKENPCVENKCTKRCFEITEERRNSLFNHFWKLDSQRRRDWILRCVQRVPIKRKRTSTPESRRTATYEYFINDGEDHRKVCQKFILQTLDITQKYLTYTIHNSEENMAKQDMRRPNVPLKYSEEIKKNVEDFIKKLPVLPSHYCRPKSEQLYLPQEYKSVSHIYRKYLEHCRIIGVPYVSDAIFRQIFNEYEISIHVPKKDKCKTCTKFDNNKDPEQETEPIMDKKLQEHLEEKTATYRRFKTHQNLNVNDTITASFDLQKVLNTPYGESMLLYYSRKYAVYNLTFYESGTQEVFCYTWGESDGNRGGNEIASCLLKYLKIVDDRGVKKLLLYCDSCTGQNKNKTVLAAISWFLNTSNHLEVIQINFLLPGHTYMPVDSVHAVIEREVKRIIVWSPSQWPTYFESARKNPRPYRVEILDHTDFLDFEKFAERIFTPSVMKKVRIMKMRTATFKKKYPRQIRIKYSMNEDTEEVRVTLENDDQTTTNVTRKGKGPAKAKGKCDKGKSKGKGKGKSKANTENTQVTVDDSIQNISDLIKPAYSDKLPISKAKYQDLKRLCDNGTIPKTYHKEYSQIPYKDSVRDYFPHSDYDEDDEED